MKKSLITLLIIAILFIGLQIIIRSVFPGNPVINQALSLLYLWSPGFVALFFSRKEGIRLPIFARPNKTFYLIPVYACAIALFAFLLSIPFGGALTPNPAFSDQSVAGIIGYVILFFFSGFVLVTLLLTVLFLGGELYWRGYLWEKLKNNQPLKAIWMTALIWSIWQIPLSFFSYSPGMPSVFLNFLSAFILLFALSPILMYFRLKCRSIISSAFFYSTFLGAFAYFIALFPTAQVRDLAIFGVFEIFALVLFCLIFKLYFPSTWEKLNQSS